MNPHVRFIAVAALSALTWTAASAGAQSASQADVRDSSRASVAIGLLPPTIVDSLTAVAETPTSENAAAVATRGPSRASARVASHAVSTPRGAPPVIQNKKSNRNALALMVVGGAALVIGAVIGDDAGTIVMLGGAGIGLYGLYLFLT
jgi:hypothetical protein